MAREIFLTSTQIYVSSRPAVLSTVVGSCVAVCLFDHTNHLGGMNHFLLPRGDATDGSPMGKFGNVAVPELLRRLVDLGADPESVVAKVVGGASILSVSSHNHIPEANVQSARRALGDLGIPIVGQDVGGKQGRKVKFFTDTGTVTVNEKRRL